MDLVDLALELFTAAYRAVPGDGEAWEGAARAALTQRGARFEQIPGGATLFGFPSASGLPHQLDAVVRLDDAYVILELKAHGTLVPKNDLLRFAGATDDFVFGLGCELPDRPIHRVMATLGRSSEGMRRFAAYRGIALIERGRWPSLVLSSPSIVWPEGDGAPTEHTREQLDRLVRPVQSVLRPVGHGHLYDPALSRFAVDALLALEDEWSGRLWAALDTRTRMRDLDGRKAA